MTRQINFFLGCIVLTVQLGTGQRPPEMYSKTDYGKASIDGQVVSHNVLRVSPQIAALPSYHELQEITVKSNDGKLYSCQVSPSNSRDIRPGDRLTVSGKIYRDEINPAFAKLLNERQRTRLEQASEALPYHVDGCKAANHQIENERTPLMVKGQILRRVDKPPTDLFPGSIEFTLKDSTGKAYLCSVPMLQIYSDYRSPDPVVVSGYVPLTERDAAFNIGDCEISSHEAASN